MGVRTPRKRARSDSHGKVKGLRGIVFAYSKLNFIEPPFNIRESVPRLFAALSVRLSVLLVHGPRTNQSFQSDELIGGE